MSHAAELDTALTHITHEHRSAPRFAMAPQRYLASMGAEGDADNDAGVLVEMLSDEDAIDRGYQRALHAATNSSLSRLLARHRAETHAARNVIADLCDLMHE